MSFSRGGCESLYPSHRGGLHDVAKSCAEQGLNLGEVVGSAERCEIAFPDNGEVGLHRYIADDAIELFCDFVELLEFLSEGVRLLFDRRVEHVDRSAVLAGWAGGVAAREVLEGPLLGETLVGTLTVGQGAFRDGRNSWLLLLDLFPKLLEIARRGRPANVSG